MDQPIACSLEAVDAQAQLGDWRDALVASVVRVERVDASTLTLHLDPASDHIAAIAELAQREVACCQFFRFALEIDAHGIALTASVPPEAATILDTFTELATP